MILSRELQITAKNGTGLHFEEARLERVGIYSNLWNSSVAKVFDDIVALAANIFDVPMAAICFTEDTKLKFKARFGSGLESSSRLDSPCNYALYSDGMFCVPDLLKDSRFAGNPMFSNGTDMPFYAGVPLIDVDGYRVGVLSVRDTKARAALTEGEVAILKSLANILTEQLDRLRVSEKLTIAETEKRSALAKAEEANARLRSAIEFLPEAIIMMDADDRIILWNNRYEQMFPEVSSIISPGLTYEELLRHSLESGKNVDVIGPDGPEAWLARRLAEHRSKNGSNIHEITNGRTIRYEQFATSDGGTICTRQDITEFTKREDSIRLLFDSNPLPMGVYDLEDYRMLAINDATVAQLGYSKQQALRMYAPDFSPPEHRQRDVELIELTNDVMSESHEAILWKADRSHFIASIQSKRISYMGRPSCLSAIVDVTEKRKQEEYIHRLAYHDFLTGLPNRLMFDEHLRSLLETSVSDGGAFAVLLVDLDNFKNVNDTLGHPIGDELIIAAAGRLRGCIRETDFVARLGGDEFALILPMADNVTQDIEFLADIVVTEMAKAFSIGGHRINIGVSVGMTFAPTDSADGATLLQNVDLALYRAKSLGRGRYQCFEPQMQLQVLAKRATELELRSAIGRGELSLHYQPLVDLQSQMTTGYEALLRWNHPTRGIVSAEEFMTVAEETGLIIPIGDWVLNEACKEATTWQPHLTVAINLSARQFKNTNIIDKLREALKLTGLAASRVELEITETALLENSEDTLQALAELRKLGTLIAMDDFGTGYSSISYLQKFHFDKIKIDRSFISELANNHQNLEIVRAVLAIGTSLGIRVLAEGIESEQEFLALRVLGCHEGQGFYFGRPLPVHAIPREFKLRHNLGK